VRERERPVDERLSLLDRPKADMEIDPPDEDEFRLFRSDVDLATVRVALRHDLGRIYLAPDARSDLDGIHIFIFKTSGGSGGAGFTRSVFREHGTCVCTTSSMNQPKIVYGALPDDVIAVRVGDADDDLGDNAFLAVLPPGVDSIVLTKADAERRVRLPHPGPRQRQPRP
jgi:hypothetical protein